jgi:hypothetical protein
MRSVGWSVGRSAAVRLDSLHDDRQVSDFLFFKAMTVDGRRRVQLTSAAATAAAAAAAAAVAEAEASVGGRYRRVCAQCDHLVCLASNSLSIVSRTPVYTRARVMGTAGSTPSPRLGLDCMRRGAAGPRRPTSRRPPLLTPLYGAFDRVETCSIIVTVDCRVIRGSTGYDGLSCVLWVRRLGAYDMLNIVSH